VTVTDRYVPLVTTAYGTRVARPLRTTGWYFACLQLHRVGPLGFMRPPPDEERIETCPA
jgi:hypothetical protein